MGVVSCLGRYVCCCQPFATHLLHCLFATNGRRSLLLLLHRSCCCKRGSLRPQLFLPSSKAIVHVASGLAQQTFNGLRTPIGPPGLGGQNDTLPTLGGARPLQWFAAGLSSAPCQHIRPRVHRAAGPAGGPPSLASHSSQARPAPRRGRETGGMFFFGVSFPRVQRTCAAPYQHARVVEASPRHAIFPHSPCSLSSATGQEKGVSV